MKKIYNIQHFFQRDCDLSFTAQKFYQVGMILQEMTFTDCSFLKGQLVKNTRFLISSAFPKELPKQWISEKVKDCGMIMFNSKSYFKVLDLFTVRGKRQITLLHILPEDINFFKKSKIPNEKIIIDSTRKDFLTSFKMEVNPNLNTEDWYSRTQLPIGFVDTIN